MNQTTSNAFFDELTKIAEGGAIGRLVNADVGANEFPDADVDTPKRGDRAQGAPRVTTKTLINTQEPAPEEQYS